MKFKKYYKFPLSLEWGNKVFTKDFGMAFDFPSKMIFPEAATLSPMNQESVVECINGGEKPKTYLELVARNGTIWLQTPDGEREFIIIRGWGNLTSPNCEGLSQVDAAKIQNEFAEYIIERLKP